MKQIFVEWQNLVHGHFPFLASEEMGSTGIWLPLFIIKVALKKLQEQSQMMKQVFNVIINLKVHIRLRVNVN